MGVSPVRILRTHTGGTPMPPAAHGAADPSPSPNVPLSMARAASQIPQNTRRAAARVARRALVRDVLLLAPRGLIAGLLAGAAVLAGLRLAGVPLSEQAGPRVGSAAPVGARGLGGALAVVRRWSRHRPAG